MKLKYLGTAAAEGFPAMFCDCENCHKAMERKGKNVRSRSQAIIDDGLLIDFPCDTYYHCLNNNINLHNIRHCIVTHEHFDHFYLIDLRYFRAGISHPAPDYKFNLYGSEDIGKKMADLPEGVFKHLNFIEVKPFEPFKVEKYTITALKAYHGTANPYIYAISGGDKTILYAHDTDVFRDETWEYMKKNNMFFDLVSLDCTEGAYEDLSYHGHMCLGRNIACRDRMLQEKLIDENTTVVLNHFSHNGLNANYDDFEPIAAKEGFLTSFDGMEINI